MLNNHVQASMPPPSAIDEVFSEWCSLIGVCLATHVGELGMLTVDCGS